MKRQIAYALIAAAAVGAGTSLALAQGGHGHGGRMMHKLDLNGDGGITSDEARAVETVRFLRMDTDGDGVITEAEMLERMQRRISERIAKRFAKMDQNGDGRVERSEYEDTAAARFTRLDTDGDGRISNDEFRAQRHYRERGRHDDKLPAQ